MKFFLIGMPYSGKTTLGRQLANELSLPFIDLDHEIEKREGSPIPEIFSKKGEDYFRITESTVLKEWTASSESFVMSTGGGAPCFHNGINIINNAGTSIFLDVPVDELVNRVGHKSDRPLLNSGDQNALTEKLTKLYTTRIDIYRKAKAIADSPSLSDLIKVLGIKR